MKRFHEPVMVQEVIEALKVKECAHLENNWFIDATLGLGGHTIEIIKNGGKVLGIDADKNSLKIAEERILKACPAFENSRALSYKLAHGNFKDIDVIARDNGLDQASGVLFDLGISSYQLETGERGFSFQHPKAQLDMRIDPNVQKVKASDLLNVLDETQLTELFFRVLTKGQSKRLAKKVAVARKKRGIETVGDFLKIVEGVGLKGGSINVATLPFMALRIAVNSEFENITEVLPKALSLLKEKGRLVVISFHSGEDGIVKSFFRGQEEKNVGRSVNRKPILPSENEIKGNPRARSAKMRVFEKN